MDQILTFVICLLGTVFICSLIVLLLLCRYKNLRKKTAFYMKKLARAELSRSDIELIEKSERKSWKLLLEKGNNKASAKLLESRCKALLNLCDSLDLTTKEITVVDISKLHYIIQVARTITEESNISADKMEKSGLLECRTTNLLYQVSKAMARMEQQLNKVEDISVQDMSSSICNNIISI